MNSQVIKILSKIFHPTNALYLALIILGSTGFNLLTISLATILYNVVHRLIGLKWLGSVALCLLGIKVICLLLSLGIKADMKIS